MGCWTTPSPSSTPGWQRTSPPRVRTSSLWRRWSPPWVSSRTSSSRRNSWWSSCNKTEHGMLHQRGNTLYGLEVLFLLHSPPSNRCGSQSKNTTKQVHPLSTGSASKYFNKVTKQSKKENKKSPRHKKFRCSDTYSLLLFCNLA